MNSLTNSTLGQYQIVDVIGRGSMATVYKAYQPSLNRHVAIKVLAQHHDPMFKSRFQREAQAVAQLQHPNILPIYDYVQQGDTQYFVMQYVEDGVTLGQIMQGAPMPPARALRLLAHLLGALEYAHRRGIIHRDIKPSNVLMLQPDWPLLADFGIAKMVNDSQQLTPAGYAIGTAAYMAPEQTADRPLDARSDLYSAGVMLYEMVTGRVPFDGVTPLAVLMKHLHDPPPPPRSLNPALPEPVESVLLRALEKEPELRYQSAAEMGQAIQAALGQIEQAERRPARPAANRYRTQELAPDKAAAGRPWRAALALALTLAGLVALALLFGPLRGSVARTEQAGPTAAPQQAAAPTAAPAAAPTGAADPAPGAPASPTEASEQEPAEALYVVAPGDTLFDIATRFETTVEALLAANGISDPDAIQAGQTLVIPASGGPATAPPPPQPTQPPIAAPEPGADGRTSIRLEDADWQGGFRRPAGLTYGGRTATWIYGYATDYNTMRSVFEVARQPGATATLRIEGMDSEGRTKTPISISINGVEIYNGLNPLPDDDLPLETGTWASHPFDFDAALLRPGRNEISISNLAEGAFSRPPFFMLDFAEVVFTAS